MSRIDHDIRSALAISNAVERMTALYAIAGELNETVPFELSKQIEVYSHILICIARLQASAQYDYGCAEAERKRVYGITLATTQGTAAQREGAAGCLRSPAARGARARRTDRVEEYLLCHAGADQRKEADTARAEPRVELYERHRQVSDWLNCV